ncbi:MAG: hypothetical protein U1E70_24580 [Acetobacteraceae bacterium]|nr:hypothetical protein [Pseudomonadota bacterium]
MTPFGTRVTASDCIARINNTLDEIASIRSVLAVLPSGGAGQADPDGSRNRSQAHLADAWASVNWALRALWFGQRDRTRDEDVAATAANWRREATELRAEVARLERALMEARAGIVLPEPSPAAPGSVEEMAQRLRRVLMGALHPDKAGSAAESAWRTGLCQSVFPEIDRIVGGR